MYYIAISDWVEKVILSCKTKEQLNSAKQLYQLYKQQTNTNSYRDIHRFLNHTINHQLNRLSYGNNGR